GALQSADDDGGARRYLAGAEGLLARRVIARNAARIRIVLIEPCHPGHRAACLAQLLVHLLEQCPSIARAKTGAENPVAGTLNRRGHRSLLRSSPNGLFPRGRRRRTRRA